MALTFSAQLRSLRPPEMKTRAFYSIVRDALIDVATEWFAKYLPRHFQAGAVQRYQYQARKPRYLRRKQRYAPSPDGRSGAPLVWSGELKRMVLQGPPTIPRPTANASRISVKLRLKGPKHLNAHRKDFNAPWLAEELRRTTADEERSLKRLLRDRVIEKLAAQESPQSATIRSAA